MKKIFITLLIIRSALDIFTDFGVTLGPITINLSSVIGILILGLGGFYFISRDRLDFPPIARWFGIWLLFLLFFSVPMSLFNFGSKGGVVALREWIRLGSILIILIMSYHLVPKGKEAYQFIDMMFWSVLIPVLTGLYQLVTHTGWKDPIGIVRVYGTFVHPNHFAFYLILFMGLTFWKYQFSRKKLLWLFLLLIQITCFTATFSLTGYIMGWILFIGTFLAVDWQKKILVATVVILNISILITTTPFQKRMEKIKQIDPKTILEKKVEVDSFTWRIFNWQGLLFLWKEKPWLGYGLNSTIFINPKKEKEKGLGYLPHNDFLRYLVETGLVGLIFYLNFILITASTLFQYYRQLKDDKLKHLFYTLFINWVAWQVGSLAGNMISGTAFLFYFWAITGFALKARKNMTIDGLNNVPF